MAAAVAKASGSGVRRTNGPATASGTWQRVIAVFIMGELGKPVAEVGVGELADHFDFPILMLQRDGRVFDAVERRRLDHRVVRHVVEHQDVADLEFAVE